ncbi:helix-turn-helix domain-containing protein [Isoptericola sp. 4D.3]|uniref:Helix-turn-helix domain-containing protein n=1 Tax=Isoptericola peretonis TaxID=2918523 RepID=A0ABT0IYT0_9MICO|nr:helix-turn-helix domain-containing protein [Isoptericola sp. 4D.3]
MTTPPSDESRATPARTVTEAKALAALAHPYRARLMDALKVDGPSTATELARRTGQAVGSASHHLKVLHDAGLVAEAPELARDRRERWWRLVTRQLRWSRHEFADDTAAVAAAQAAEALHLQRQFDRVRAWQANAESAPEWDRTAFATETWLHLTPAELAELGEEITAVLVRWGQRPTPDDGAEREPVLVFGRGFPAQP